jgi:hypothetical protein
VEVLRFLHQAYPESLTTESLTMLTTDQGSLMHEVFDWASDGVTDKAQYLLEQSPEMVRMVNNRGFTPLHSALRFLYSKGSSHIPCIKNFFYADPLLARIKCTPSDTNSSFSERLPLHILIEHGVILVGSPFLEVSGLGD